MLKPGKLKNAFKKVEEENWMFRAFLKEREPDELDRLVNSMHHELFKDIDCVACSNCCKTIIPVLTENDISRISGVLGVTVFAFKDKYLKKKNEGRMVESVPCPFLTDKGCSIYEHRPETCQEYPSIHIKAGLYPGLSTLLETVKFVLLYLKYLNDLKRFTRETLKSTRKKWQYFGTN